MKAALSAAFLIFAAGPALAQGADADAAFRATTLSLQAYGEAKAQPDMAAVTLGVSTQAATAAEALRLNAQRMTAVLTSLRALGLGERDIQTSNLSLGPQYVNVQNLPPKLSGYQASNDVRVTVTDLTKLGPVIDAVGGAGANQINGVSFGLKDSDAAENEARRAAVKALAAKADLYAQASGYHIVRLVNLSEGGGEQPMQPRPVFAMAKAAAPTPVEPGELNVRIDVSAVYELAK
ncbi:MAG TPA: SIMPL domain-containing protein [Caulobacteraceae bacterium]|nr:SIMPL domain-containing protein [Caulobacteraceae bacterium]